MDELAAQPTAQRTRLQNEIARARRLAARIDRRVGQQFADVEARQLSALRRAYDGDHPPEILIFGDSVMYWTSANDADPRRVCDMIRDRLGRRTLVLYGPGYHARIILAFLAALERCRHRPKLVVVPNSVMMLLHGWFEHPEFNYVTESRSIMKAVVDGGPLKRVERTPVDVADAYDRTIAPSFIGAERTYGELRMIIEAKAQTPWQKQYKLGARMDFYHAEELKPDSPGVVKVRELGSRLRELSLPTVGYIPQVQRDALRQVAGEDGPEHARRNAELVEGTFREAIGDLGVVANAVLESPGTDFIDPIHTGPRGRALLTERIAQAAETLLS
jgi:hypothetical protein